MREKQSERETERERGKDREKRKRETHIHIVLIKTNQHSAIGKFSQKKPFDQCKLYGFFIDFNCCLFIYH